MLVYGLYHLFYGNFMIFLLAAVCAYSLGSSWYYMRKYKAGLLTYRMSAGLFTVLLLLLIHLGGSDGSMILWMFTYPLISFFLFGTREGLLWSAGMIFMVLLLFWFPPPWLDIYDYSTGFKIRFINSYFIVSGIAYWFEFLRNRYHHQSEQKTERLEKEQQLLKQQILERKKAEAEKEQLIKQLRESLEEIKTLSGLLPICASCHKIRDDKGYWNQLEKYISFHTEVKFSHGFCPDCAARLRAELQQKK